MEQFSANNPNPVLSVANNGTVLYSNQAGEPLLHEWGVKVGEKLPSYIEDFVQKVISLNSPEKMEVKVGKRVYSVAFHPSPDEEFVNIYGFDISDQKELEEKYHNIVEKSTPCQVLLDENHALRDEIQSLRARLEEPEELQRAISEGDLDALVMPVLEEDVMVFTLNSADQAYRILMETANEDVLIVDAEFKITYAGKRLINKIGYSQEEVIGRSWLDFVDEESKVYSDLRMKNRRQGSNENYELKLIRQDGSPLWILASSKPLFDENGKFKGALSMLTDITERKQTEEKLAAAHSQIQSIIDNTPDIIYAFDLEKRFVLANTTVANVFNSMPDRMIGKRRHEFMPKMDADWHEANDRQVFEAGKVLEFEEYSCLEGRSITWLTKKFPLRDAQGRIYAVAGISADITERKRAEEALRESEARLQVVIAHSPDIIFEQDRDLRYNWIFNPTSPYAVSDVLGKTDAELLPPDQAQQLESIKRRVLNKGIREQVILQLAPGGELRWYEAIYDPRFNEAGQVIGVLSYTRDITERKRAEEALREAEETARQRLVEIGDLYRNAPVGLCVLDRELRWVRINERLAEINGIPAAAHIGKRVRDLMPQLADAVEPEMFRVMETGQPRLDIEIVSETPARPSVKRSWLEQWLPITDSKGKVTGLSIVVEEITERKRAEEWTAYLASYPELNPNPIFEVGPDGMVRYANPAAKQIFPDLAARGIDHPILGGFREIVDLFIGSKSSLVRDVKFNDNFYQQAIHLVSDRKIVRFYNIDITERKKAVNELRETYEKIHKQSEELQVFNEELQVQSEELREANEALIESEKRFRTLAENSPDVITRFDRQNRHMHANPAASEAYGFSQEEIIGKTHGELGRNPELVKFLETYQEIVFTTGKPEAMEFHYKSPQGKEYYFNTKIVPEFTNGKVTSVLAISRDITDIKEAEAKLKETLDNLENLVKARTTELEKAYSSLKDSERSLAEAQKMAHLGNWSHNIKTGEVHWSDEVYRIFGFKPQECGVTYNIFLSKVYPDDRDFLNNAFKQILNGNIFDIEYRIVLAGGVERIVHEEFEVIFDKENIPILLNGTVQDITERKKVEEALELANAYNRSLIEASIDSLVTIGPNGKITDVNNSTELITGYSCYELIGTDFSDYFTEPKKAREGYQHVFQKGLVRNYPLEIQHKNGNITPVLYNASVYRDEAGKVVGVFAAARDITELKKAEEYLANIEIARKQEIHHRIKNNLQVISSLLDLQAEQFRDQECIKDSEVLKAFRESQSRVISMALIHEELYKGGGFDTLDFSSYIEELAENLFRTYRLGNTDVSLNMDLEENLFFDMDTAVPLGIIVNELVSNSLKHAFPGRDRGEIRIELRREENGDCINVREESKSEDCISTEDFILTVSDNGIGISEDLDVEDLDSLGLQLVTTLVDQLDGELELKRNNGTEFTMRFTVTEKNNQASAPAPQLIE